MLTQIFGSSVFGIAAAVMECGFKLPGKRITINTAPADHAKKVRL